MLNTMVKIAPTAVREIGGRATNAGLNAADRGARAVNGQEEKIELTGLASRIEDSRAIAPIAQPARIRAMANTARIDSISRVRLSARCRRSP